MMLENIVRHMEMGKPPLQAALDGSREIGFTILSMTLSLVAVFIPVLFMGGILGPAVPRVRRHHRRGDPGLGLRLADADADAVQPLPARRSASSSTAALYRVVGGASTTGVLRGLRATACGWVMRAPARRRWSFSLAILAGTVVPVRHGPQGLHPERGHGHDLRARPRRRRGPRSRRWCAHQQQVAAIVPAGPERRRASCPSVGRRATRARLLHPAQAARRSASSPPTR